MQKIQEQIAKIIDTGDGDRRKIIVRVGGKDEREKSLVRLAASAISQRNMSLSARDCLPLEKKHTHKTKAPQDQEFPRDAKGVSARIGKIAAGAGGYRVLRDYAFGRLDSSLKNDLVIKAAHEVERSKAETGTVQSFWTSKSMLLDMSKDDLTKLPEQMPNVQAVYPNRQLRVPRLVAIKNMPIPIRENKISSWGLQKIGALATWGAYGARGKGIRVGVLDTGVDAGHPDLDGKVVRWAEFDAEGKQVSSSKAHDSDRHGTHCCGIIAGGNRSGQWIGVAPEAELAVALVLNGEEGGTDAQILAGIDWLVEQSVHVISMSLGGLTMDPETPSTYTEAILTCLRAGIPVVTAIGNEGSQTTGSPGNDIFAFSVGATDYLDHAAGFSGGRTQILKRSQYIPPENLPLPYSKPELSAPGVAIQSSVPGGKYEAFNGTSMATPHVAGAVALLLSNTSVLTTTKPAERGFLIQDLLTGSVEELGESGQNHRFGFGRIDILRAIGFAKELGY
jgi:hypothetical protein